MAKQATMTEAPRRRRSLRVHLETTLNAYISGARRGTARVRDLALGGAFLETELKFAVGDLIHLEILSGSPHFQSEAKVQNILPEGIGIEFLQMKPEDHALLRLLITELLK
jgi:hypothetical protein